MLNLVPQSDCAQAREAASARLDCELSELEAVRLDVHLRACAECRAYADGIQTITAGLRAAPLERPEIRVIVPRRRLIPVPAAAATAAAVLLTAVAGSSFAIGGMLGRQGSHVPPPATTETSALAGSTEQLVLSMVRGQRSAPFRVTSRILAV